MDIVSFFAQVRPLNNKMGHAGQQQPHFIGHLSDVLLNMKIHSQNNANHTCGKYVEKNDIRITKDIGGITTGSSVFQIYSEFFSIFSASVIFIISEVGFRVEQDIGRMTNSC